VADVDAFTPPPDESDAGDDARRRRARHKRRHEQKKGSFWRELPILIVTALVLTFLIQTFLARVYVIPSQSMETTLHGCTGCTNDRVLVDKLSYRFTDPEPGDVVVFKGPESWGENPEFDTTEPANPLARGLRQFGALIGLAHPDERDFVKRVIATGGQTVQCCDERARVLVDGKPLDEPYLYFENGRGSAQEPFAPVQVPAGHLWVMGDNRNNSSDSRRHVEDDSSGTIPVGNVIGKARVIVLPPGRWGGIDDHNPQALGHGLPATVGLLMAWPVLARRTRRRR
jgi:signal peptidase I